MKELNVTEDQVSEWAFNGATTRTIATLCGEDEHTIDRRFGALIAKKRAERRYRLAEAQTRLAIEDGDKTMLIWVGKNELAQSDQPPDDADAEPELASKEG